MNTFNQLYEAISRRNFLKNIGKGVVGSALSTPASALNVVNKLATTPSPLNLDNLLLKFVSTFEVTDVITPNYFNDILKSGLKLKAALNQKGIDTSFLNHPLNTVSYFNDQTKVEDIEDLFTNFVEGGDDNNTIEDTICGMVQNNIPISNKVWNKLEGAFGIDEEYIHELIDEEEKYINRKNNFAANKEDDSIEYSRLDKSGGSEDIQGKDYTTLEQTSFDNLVNCILQEKKDRCYHRAVQAYGTKTSAYRSAAMVKCRKGKIWKRKKKK